MYTFDQAVDVVCINCIYCRESKCRRCPVRKTVDKMNKKKDNAKKG